MHAIYAYWTGTDHWVSLDIDIRYHSYQLIMYFFSILVVDKQRSGAWHKVEWEWTIGEITPAAVRMWTSQLTGCSESTRGEDEEEWEEYEVKIIVVFNLVSAYFSFQRFHYNFYRVSAKSGKSAESREIQYIPWKSQDI